MLWLLFHKESATATNKIMAAYRGFWLETKLTLGSLAITKDQLSLGLSISVS